MTEKVKVAAPTRGYDIGLVIKEKKYDNDVISVRIVSSLKTAWQIVSVVVRITPQDIILNHLYGKDEIKLSMTLTAQNQLPAETIEMDLMLVSSDFEVPVTTQMAQGKQSDRSYIRLLCIPRPSFETITLFVNKIYGVHLGSGWTQKEIIADMLGDTSNLEMDIDGENKVPVDQICIPPTTLYNGIMFLDSVFGLYNGVPSVFCQYDGKLQIKNLSAQMNKSQIITVEQLASDADNKKTLESSGDGKNYYTYDNVTTTYVGNTKYAVMGKEIFHVIRPIDKLYAVIEHDLDSIIASAGLIDKNKQAPINTSIAKRKKYYNEHGGDRENETLMISMMAKKIAALSTISFGIDRNIRVENLLNIGSAVKFKFKTADFVDVSGKFILETSDISLDREGGWEATAQLDLIRTNKTK